MVMGGIVVDGYVFVPLGAEEKKREEVWGG